MKPGKGVATPVLKWAGGKRWVIPWIGQSIRDHLDAHPEARFIDPFTGGGALPLWLGHERMILGDACVPLMEMYQTLRESPGEVAWSLSAMAINGIDRENFEMVRDLEPKTPAMRAARMIFLNKLGFNGLYRVNGDGKFNVPYAEARFRKSIVERSERDAITSLFPNKEKFINVGKALKDAELYWCDFVHLVRLAGEGDILYLDPPYDESYDQYTAERFKSLDQQQLADEVWEAHEAGAIVFVHNSPTDLVRELYDGLHFIEAKEKRQINSDVKGRHRVPCWLITNRPDMVKVP